MTSPCGRTEPFVFETQPLVHEDLVKTLCCNEREVLGVLQLVFVTLHFCRASDGAQEEKQAS